jgi:hypothetical protein
VASLSFRDRFFSPPVAHALTSPSGILSLGAGAAVGIVATAPVSVPLAVVGAVVGGILGLGARVAVALPRNDPGPRIDPFAVDEPWRHAVIDAIKARSRFDQAVATFKSGPLRESMTMVASRLEEAVGECWRVAQQGQIVADARKGINDREVAWELNQVRSRIGAGGPDETQQATLAALQAQVDTAQRMDALLGRTKSQLDLLNARLDESVTRAIELSVSNQTSAVGSLGEDVGAIVDDLEALRMAIEDVDHGPVAATGPPPLPRAQPADGSEGRSQTSPGS